MTSDANRIPAHEHPRFVEGRRQLAWLVGFLLSANDLSHASLTELQNALCPEQVGWLHKSQVTLLAAAKQPKPGLQVIDALGELNLALARLAGHLEPPVPPLPQHFERLRGRARYVKNPTTGQPLGPNDLFAVLCGRLPLHNHMTAEAAAALSRQVALWVQQWLLFQGVIVSQGHDVVLRHYPGEYEHRRQKAWQVVMGQSVWSAVEAEDELPSLKAMLGSMHHGEALSDAEFELWHSGQLQPAPQTAG